MLASIGFAYQGAVTLEQQCHARVWGMWAGSSLSSGSEYPNRDRKDQVIPYQLTFRSGYS